MRYHLPTTSRSRLFWLLLFLFVSTITAVDLHLIVTDRDQAVDKALTDIEAEVAEEARKISSLLERLRVSVTDLSGKVSKGELPATCFEKSLTDKACLLQVDLLERMEGPETFSGLGVAIEPYRRAEVNGRPRSHLYYFSNQSEPVETAIDYDYTAFKHSWYRKPRIQGSSWIEPYWGVASKAILAEYGAGFATPDSTRGVVFGSVSAEKIRQLTNFSSDGIVDFQLLSKSGRFVLRPHGQSTDAPGEESEFEEKNSFKSDSIFEYAWREKEPGLNSIAMKALSRAEKMQELSKDDRAQLKAHRVSYSSPNTREKTHIISFPVAETGWSLIAVVDDSALHDHNEMRQQWFNIIPMFIASASLAALLIVVFPKQPLISPLYSSFIFSAFVFLGIAGLWFVSGIYPLDISDGERRITSKNMLEAYKDSLSASMEKPPTLIDTGVFVQSLEFEGANNVKITAYVWQHYEKGTHKNMERGFLLPEAENPTIEQVYREQLDDDDEGCASAKTRRDCSELLGWSVAATLRQDFDYGFFPLDSHRVWLKLWPLEFGGNVALSPDLNSYPRLSPEVLPGVQKPFVLPGWRLDQSWFSINDQSFNTNFGSAALVSENTKQELLFNVRITRDFLNPFVSRVIPLVLVAVLMFLIVLISTKSSRESEWLGFSASNTVAGLSALFFVVGINHSDLRQHLSSPTIMYFEYFYFVIYVMLLYVAISSIRIAKNSFVDGHDENLASSLSYWPVLSLVLFGLTFGVFY